MAKKKIGIEFAREMYISDPKMTIQKLSAITGWGKSALEKRCSREQWRMLRKEVETEDGQLARKVGICKYATEDLEFYTNALIFMKEYVEESAKLGLEANVSGVKQMVELYQSTANVRNIITGISEEESEEVKMENTIKKLTEFYEER